MVNIELSASIRNDLKASGISPRAVRVSVRDAGYSTAIRARITSPEVSAEAVRVAKNLMIRHRICKIIQNLKMMPIVAGFHQFF